MAPESEARALRERVRELERMLGKKTMEVEVLKETVDIARSRKWLPRLPHPHSVLFAS